MSQWTSIHAVIDVDFGNQTDYFIRDFFDSRRKDNEYTLAFDLKKKGDGFEITGSEMNAVAVVEPLRNHVIDGRDRYFHGQRHSITIFGNLRDRTLEETVLEWQRFYDKLKKFVEEECHSVSKNYEFDNTAELPRILYFNVDITDYVERYHQCSMDEDKLKDYVRIEDNEKQM